MTFLQVQVGVEAFHHVLFMTLQKYVILVLVVGVV